MDKLIFKKNNFNIELTNVIAFIKYFYCTLYNTYNLEVQLFVIVVYKVQTVY